MGSIILEGMEFFSYHGCFREEQVIGAKFLLDLVIETDTSKAEISDHLADTINYTSLYQLVKDEMNKKSFLLEHVAKRIVDRLRGEFPQLEYIHLKISKINPPVGGKMKQVQYVTFWKK